MATVRARLPGWDRLPGCDCRPCEGCGGEYLICAKCGRCTRHSEHVGGCPGCPAGDTLEEGDG